MDFTSKRRDQGTSALRITGLFLWVFMPIAIIVLLLVSATRQELEPARAVYVELERSQLELKEPVDLALTWGPGSAVVAPAWEGVVQKVHVSPGDEIKSGTRLARVGGVTRFLFQSEQPFSEPLTSGDETPDVLELQRFLNSVGFTVEETSVFDAETLAGVRQLAWEIGVPNSDQVTTFSPDWVVFLPNEAIASTIDLVVGAPAPSAGSHIVLLEPELTNAFVAELGTLSEMTEPQSDLGSREAPYKEAWRYVDSNETLVFEEEVLTLDESRVALTSEALEFLADHIPTGASAISVDVLLTTEEDEWVLPAPAVVVDSTASACVFVKSKDWDRPVPVDVVAEFDGRLVVEGAPLSAGLQIRVYPYGDVVKCAP